MFRIIQKYKNICLLYNGAYFCPMTIKPIRKYVLIKIDSPSKTAGPLEIPKTGQKRLNSGTVVSFCPTIGDIISVGDRVCFMEYSNSMWTDNEHCIVPYVSLNAKNRDGKLHALGSKILVHIDKQKQRENRYISSAKLFIPDFNNEFTYNNQFGGCVSVGPDVEEKIKPNDIALINQFVEGTPHSLVWRLPNGDEIRVVETGTNMNYQWYGYINDGEIISSKHYVFVNEKKNEGGLQQLSSGILLPEKQKSAYDTKTFVVSHRTSDGKYYPGDTILARGMVAKVGQMDIFYVNRLLIIETVNKMIHDTSRVDLIDDKLKLVIQ